mmetsp:Transcript_42538/g.128795  ORF Transcript_42538/g.128795 Transcript_42538/m.128795 type:complete len:231 (+) Transcript_42538:468-1160(+)
MWLQPWLRMMRTRHLGHVCESCTMARSVMSSSQALRLRWRSFSVLSCGVRKRITSRWCEASASSRVDGSSSALDHSVLVTLSLVPACTVRISSPSWMGSRASVTTPATSTLGTGSPRATSIREPFTTARWPLRFSALVGARPSSRRRAACIIRSSAEMHSDTLAWAMPRQRAQKSRPQRRQEATGASSGELGCSLSAGASTPSSSQRGQKTTSCISVLSTSCTFSRSQRS